MEFDTQGRLYIATGDNGEIFRVEKNGQGAVFFKSDEAHMRVLTFDPKGNLIAGSDGSGLVYRISSSRGQIRALQRARGKNQRAGRGCSRKYL